MSKKQNIKPSTAQSSQPQPITEKKPWISENATKWIYIGITCVFLLIIWSARMRLLDIPFERDEGSYSYMGQLLMEGQRPYIDFYEMKLPGIFYAYGILGTIFGNSVEGMHLGFGVVSTLSALFVWLSVRKMFDPIGAAAAATIGFSILSLGKYSAGHTAQAEHLVVLFAMIGFYLTVLAIQSGKFWQFLLAGAALGMSTAVKQSGAFFALASGLMVILAYIKPLDFKKILLNGLLLVAGFMLIIGFFVTLMYMKGSYNEMNFWVFDISNLYTKTLHFFQTDQDMKDGNNLTGSILMQTSMTRISEGYRGLWFWGILGMFAIWFTNTELYKKTGVILLGIMSLVSVSIGFYFYGHYYIQLMPGLAVLIGAAYFSLSSILNNALKSRLGNSIAMVLFTIFGFAAILFNSDYYFSPNKTKITREMYGDNPFVETDAIANYIKSHSKETGPIAVFGSEPQIYFQTQRKCPHRHSFIGFTSMDDVPNSKGWKEEVKKSVEDTKPEYIVMVHHPFSWHYDPDAHDLYRFGVEYAQKNQYEVAGIADIVNGAKPIFVWEQAAQNYKPQSANFVVTLRRKN